MLENRQQTEDETINGYVDHIIYRNADNGYTVLVMICDEEEVTCVGTFSDIAEGENIEAHGNYNDHPTYGRQFAVKDLKKRRQRTRWPLNDIWDPVRSKVLALL